MQTINGPSSERVSWELRAPLPRDADNPSSWIAWSAARGASQLLCEHHTYISPSRA